MAKTMNHYSIWILASRPKTLLASFVPVIVGSSIAYMEYSFNVSAAIVALICSVLIQVGTNFTNDLYDFEKGADTKTRVGPLRVLNEGFVTPKQLKIAIILVFLFAFSLGLYLVYLRGLLILLIGIISIIAGLSYTAGPFPLAYNGLGDVFVFVFFGVIGTVGSYFVQTGELSSIAIWASIPVGALITNILVVNNYRDIETDKLVGKNTLAVKLGKSFSRYQYVILIVVSFIVPIIIYIFYTVSYFVFLPYLILPWAYKLVSMLFKLEGQQFNYLLEQTAKFSALFGFLFSLGFIL